MRILVISDVHANLVALEAVLAAAGEVDGIWNLGDTVGYGPRPRECLDRIAGLGTCLSLAGNHDWAAIGQLGLDEFNPVARISTEWTQSQLTIEHIDFLMNLPVQIHEECWTLVHASPRHPIWEYVYTAKAARDNFHVLESQVCFLGHTHIQLFVSHEMAENEQSPAHPENGEDLFLGDSRYIINPGSVGQPRDNNPQAAFAIYDTDSRSVSFQRVEYDVSRTQLQMEKAGLPRSLISRIAVGV